MRWKTLGRGKAKGKYGNEKTVVDGLKFDSLKEARRYRELCLLQKAGEIAGLKYQEAFELCPPVKFTGQRQKPAIVYRADFTYKEDGKLVVEDVKSAATRKLAVYRLKKHMMLAFLGIEVKEV